MWQNGAKWVADGTYRSVKGNVVRDFNCDFGSGGLIRNGIDFACPPNFGVVHSEATVRMGGVPGDGGNKEDSVSDH
jgi:hypothetical protein